MQLSVEVSLYPLHDEYIPIIIDFIHRVESYEGIEMERSSTSTQLFGDYDELMRVLSLELKNSWEQHGRSVLVAKFLCGDVRKNP